MCKGEGRIPSVLPRQVWDDCTWCKGNGFVYIPFSEKVRRENARERQSSSLNAGIFLLCIFLLAAALWYHFNP